eukprot:COSAG05_NODE_5131_length_1257_cov_0.988774_1_plen_94_part_00
MTTFDIGSLMTRPFTRTDEEQLPSALEELLKEVHEEESMLPGLTGSRRELRLLETVDQLIAIKCAEVEAQKSTTPPPPPPLLVSATTAADTER